jgi:hypothetical protein
MKLTSPIGRPEWPEAMAHTAAAVMAGYHVEHEGDDRHKIVHATGSISERGRTVPMGEWAPIPVGRLAFSASGTMTWTVPAAGVVVRVMRIGTTIFLNFAIPATTVVAPLSMQLIVTLPDDTYKAAVTTRQTSLYLFDNGVLSVGVAFILAGQRLLQFQRTDQAALTASAGATQLFGTFTYEGVS